MASTPPETVPLGPEIDWTEEQMDALLSPSASDLVLSEQLWEEGVDPLFKDLLFADDEPTI